jgi:hypothetical protein
VAHIPLILTINPGTTTTRLGLFEPEDGTVTCVTQIIIEHDESHMAGFATISSQLSFRAQEVMAFLSSLQGNVSLAAVAGRGGMLSPVPAGVISVNDASEKISERQPATMDSAALAREALRGDFGTMRIEGPFGYDVAVSSAAAQTKGLTDTQVAGKADLIQFPSLEAGNATAKAWKFHGQARTASIVLGASVPVLLNSRSDGVAQRRLGLLLAQAMIAGLATFESRRPLF